MIAAIYASKSTEQNDVGDKESLSPARLSMRKPTRR